jgi:hypothetical protein
MKANERQFMQVSTASIYMHARVQQLTQASAQTAPPGSVQYFAVVTGITAVTCAAACMLAVMPASMHVPMGGILQWATVARGAIMWGLFVAPLLILALANLQRAYSHAHVLQTAGMILLRCFG